MSPLSALFVLALLSVVVAANTDAQGGEKARVCGKKLEDRILEIKGNCAVEKATHVPLTAEEREDLQKKSLIRACCTFGCSRREIVEFTCIN